jgi:hypothetical protein
LVNKIDAWLHFLLATVRNIARTFVKECMIKQLILSWHAFMFLGLLLFPKSWLQEEQDEHGQGKWEGKQKGKSDKRITESKA